MGKSVLVVDDELTIREMLRLALNLEGYTVYTAADGRQGVEILAKIPRPDVILLDLMMPVMDGWGFVESLEANETLASIPVVVITAFSRNTRPIKARRTLQKPLDLELLYAVVKEYSA